MATSGYFRDIGTPEDYQKATPDWDCELNPVSRPIMLSTLQAMRNGGAKLAMARTVILVRIYKCCVEN